MKTAILQCNPVTGDIAGNLERISMAVRRAGRVDLCVTPELALSGVAPGDFLSQNDFVEGCRRGLDILAARFVGGPDLLIGAPVVSVYNARLLSNAAVHISGGQWDVVSRKIRPEDSVDADTRFYDRGVSCGIMTVGGWRLGVVLCEDDESFWNIQGMGYQPLTDLISRGVDAIIHMKASPYVIGRRADVEAMLTHVAARHHIHLLSVNLVGGNGGLVYGGQSLALDPTGAVYARGRAFAEDDIIVDMATGKAPVASVGKVWQENVFDALVLGTRDFVRKSGYERAAVAVTGGIDSGLVLAVAVEALSARNVAAFLLTSEDTTEEATQGARQLAANLGLTVSAVPVDQVLDAMRRTLPAPADGAGPQLLSDLRARVRGTLLSSLAAGQRALVLSPVNKSESAMGFCTLSGDTVGALSVVGDLTKTQVHAVAEWLNTARGGHLFPASVLRKPHPSAGRGKASRQSSAASLPYAELDPVLDALLSAEPRRRAERLHARQDDVRSRVFAMEFKRRQAPRALCVSGRPFVSAWTVPLAGRFRLP